MKMGERRGARERPHAGKIHVYREDRLGGCVTGNGLCEQRLERRTVQEHKNSLDLLASPIPQRSVCCVHLGQCVVTLLIGIWTPHSVVTCYTHLLPLVLRSPSAECFLVSRDSNFANQGHFPSSRPDFLAWKVVGMNSQGLAQTAQVPLVGTNSSLKMLVSWVTKQSPWLCWEETSYFFVIAVVLFLNLFLTQCPIVLVVFFFNTKIMTFMFVFLSKQTQFEALHFSSLFAK